MTRFTRGAPLPPGGLNLETTAREDNDEPERDANTIETIDGHITMLFRSKTWVVVSGDVCTTRIEGDKLPPAWRVFCCCGLRSKRYRSMGAAQVAGWLHLRAMSKAPRAV